MRDEQYATDHASSWDVVRYVINEYQKRGEEYEAIALLQPTTPLRTAEDIIGAYNTFLQKDANAVIRGCAVEHSPLWTDTLPEDYNMKGFVDKKYREIPRQQRPTYYRVNGAIYLVRVASLSDIMDLYDKLATLTK